MTFIDVSHVVVQRVVHRQHDVLLHVQLTLVVHFFHGIHQVKEYEVLTDEYVHPGSVFGPCDDILDDLGVPLPLVPIRHEQGGVDTDVVRQGQSLN